MNILPPSFKFDGDKDKATSYKAYAGQFYKLITTQAAKEGVPHVTRTKILPDGTIINFSAQKNSIFKNWSGSVHIITSVGKPIIPPEIIDPFVTYNKIISTATGLAYISGSKPKPATTPFNLINGNLFNSDIATTLLKNPDVYSTYRYGSGGILFFNRPTSLSGYRVINTFNTSNLRDLCSTQFPGITLQCTGTAGIWDAISNKGSIFSISINTTNNSTVYLDKYDFGTSTVDTVATIVWDKSTAKFEISLTHPTYGTLTKNIGSSVFQDYYTSSSNLIFSGGQFSPDGSFLNLLFTRFGSYPEYNMVIDATLKIDSDGIVVDPSSSDFSITVLDSNLSTLPEWSVFKDFTASGYFITSRYRSNVQLDTLKTDLTSTVYDIGRHPLLYLYSASPDGTSSRFANGYIDVEAGDFESQFEALFSPGTVTSFSYIYASSPIPENIRVTYTDDVVHIFKSDFFLFVGSLQPSREVRGSVKRTYSFVKEGDVVFTSLFQKESGSYSKNWIKGDFSFIDSSGVDTGSTSEWSLRSWRHNIPYDVISFDYANVPSGCGVDPSLVLADHYAKTMNPSVGDPYGFLVETTYSSSFRIALKLSLSGYVIGYLPSDILCNSAETCKYSASTDYYIETGGALGDWASSEEYKRKDLDILIKHRSTASDLGFSEFSDRRLVGSTFFICEKDYEYDFVTYNWASNKFYTEKAVSSPVDTTIFPDGIQVSYLKEESVKLIVKKYDSITHTISTVSESAPDTASNNPTITLPFSTLANLESNYFLYPVGTIPTTNAYGETNSTGTTYILNISDVYLNQHTNQSHFISFKNSDQFIVYSKNPNNNTPIQDARYRRPKYESASFSPTSPTFPTLKGYSVTFNSSIVNTLVDVAAINDITSGTLFEFGYSL